MSSWLQAQSYVGNEGNDYFVAGILQLELLKRNGLRPHHHVLEVGCGALVAGRPILQYLEPDRYVGIEPNPWLIETARTSLPDTESLFIEKRPVFLGNVNFNASEAGRKFDFVIAHSILSHAAHWQLPEFCRNVEPVLARHGVVLASIRFHDENNVLVGDSMHEEWQYPGVSYFAFDTVKSVATEVGLFAEDRPDYREFFTRYLPSNFHDWIRLRRFTGSARTAVPPTWYGKADANGAETQS